MAEADRAMRQRHRWIASLLPAVLAASSLAPLTRASAVAPPPVDSATSTTTDTASTSTSTSLDPPDSSPTTLPPSTTTPTEPSTTSGTAPPRPKDPIKDSPIVSWPATGQVAISFDDGPVARYTGQALQILGRAKVPATFFVNCIRFDRPGGAAVVKAAAIAGHSIQNHTWDHPYLGSTKTPEVVSELLSCSRAIKRLTGTVPTVFRPPYGSTSPRVEGIAKWLGMAKVMWNVCPSKMIFTATSVESGIERQIRRKAADHRQGIVILLHDGSGSAAATMAALPGIIRFLKSLGYHFVRLG